MFFEPQKNYIYLLQSGEDVGTDIYKIGRTIDIPKRLGQYPRGTVLLCSELTHDVFNAEKHLIQLFKQNFSIARGNEYFHGERSHMIALFKSFVYQRVNECSMDTRDPLCDVFYNYTSDVSYGGKYHLVKVVKDKNNNITITMFDQDGRVCRWDYGRNQNTEKINQFMQINGLKFNIIGYMR